MDESSNLNIWKMSVSPVQQFLRRVWWRHTVVCLARRWQFFSLIGIGLYSVALLLSRLLGLIPPLFTPMSLAILPAATFILAWLSYRRPRASDAARVADAQMGNHDLFLT